MVFSILGTFFAIKTQKVSQQQTPSLIEGYLNATNIAHWPSILYVQLCDDSNGSKHSTMTHLMVPVGSTQDLPFFEPAINSLMSGPDQFECPSLILWDIIY